MNKLLLLIFIGLIWSACTDSKKQENDLRDDLLRVHDKIMGNDEMLMKNKMKLDSLLKRSAIDAAEKIKINALDNKLGTAEEAMENWMHQFEPDVTGKSHEEIMNYYNKQKKIIMSVDSQMNVAIAESNKYLSNKSK